MAGNKQAQGPDTPPAASLAAQAEPSPHRWRTAGAPSTEARATDLHKGNPLIGDNED